MVVLPPRNEVKKHVKGGLCSNVFVRLDHGHSIRVQCPAKYARHVRCGNH